MHSYIKKGLLVIVAILALLAALFVVLPGLSLRQPGEREFRVDRDEELVRVELSRPGEELVALEKTAEGQWLVNDSYHANEQAIRELLSAFMNLEVRRPVPSGQRSQIKDELEEKGVHVEVFAKRHWINIPGSAGFIPRQQRIRHYIALPQNSDNHGHVMRLSHADMPYEVHLSGMPADMSELLALHAHSWRDPYVAALTPGEITKVQATVHANETESYQWYLSAGEDLSMLNHEAEVIAFDKIDKEKLAPYFHQIQRLHYERLLPGTNEEKPADLLSHKPFYTLIVDDVYDHQTKLEFFKRSATVDGTLQPGDRLYDTNRFYLRVNDGDYALAQYVVFQPVIRPFSWFIKNGDHSFTFFE